VTWSNEWQLPVSVSKCSILAIGCTYGGIYYHLNGTEVPQNSICCNLGVTIMSDLPLSQHITEIVTKTHQRAKHIICCFISGGNTHLLVTAFIA